MEKLNIRQFCAILAFLTLQFSSDVSMAEQQQTFINVMKNDEKLCPVSSFLYNSSLTKDCRNTEYPTEVSGLGYTNWNTFMCLLVYDTSYRICNYGKNWENPFNSSAAFNAYFDNFSTIKNETEKQNFCKNIRELTPVYDKTKQFILPLFNYLSDTKKCNSWCFAIPEQLNPLCTVLGWVKNVDDSMQKILASNRSSNNSPPIDRKVSDKPVRLVSPHGNADNSHAVGSGENNHRNSVPMAIGIEGNQGTGLEDKKISNDVENNLHRPMEPILNPATNLDTKKSKSQEKDEGKVNPKNDGNIKSTNAETPQGVARKNENANENSDKTNNHDKDPTPKELDEKSNNDVGNNGDAPKNSQRIQGTNIKGNNQDNPDNGPKEPTSKEKPENQENLPVTNKDIKTSTISDNTQELAGGQEYSNLDNDPYDQDDDANRDGDPIPGDKNQNIPEPSEQREVSPQYHSIRPDEESHFFTYFTVLCLISIAGYIGYHNKQKILAIVVEGRRSRNSRNRRRPSTANYRKLDCTLEEAVTSQCNANVTHVIY